MPLTMAEKGCELVVESIHGLPDVKKHLEHLGIVKGQVISVIAESAGNLIVDVKGARIAISKALATKIYV